MKLQRLCPLLFSLLIVPKGFAKDIVIGTQVQNSLDSTIISEILDEAYSQLGRHLVVKAFPLERSLYQASEGLVDGELYRIAGLTTTYPTLIQVPVVLATGDVVVFSRSKHFRVTGWASLEPYQVAYVRGFKVAENNLTPQTAVTPVTTTEQAFALLDAGRVDIVVATFFNGLGVIKAEELTDIVALASPLVRVPVYHYLNVKNKDLVAPLAAVLRRMDAAGRLLAIRKKILADNGFGQP